MQTFLPFSDFSRTANVLDMRRLGKQRVETLQILQALHNTTGKNSWITHPATQMWKGFENCLVQYGLAICREWILRGYKDTCLEKISKFNNGESIPPNWLGNEKFHSVHRGILLDKNYEWYKQFNWEDPRLSRINNSYPYYWPTKDKK
jgi:hypothetical protein